MLHALRRFLREASLGFCALNRIQFSAPWNPDRRGC